MAEITPIRGIRYNTPQAGGMPELITPPYDVIDQKAQDEFYNLNPHNIIRLEYGKVLEGDDDSQNRYTRAARDFTLWKEQNILKPEAKPAIYIYQQEFDDGPTRRTRQGLICGVKLEPYEKGIVLPHEETMPKHKADRLALMTACEANFSPIFSLYPDPEKRIEAIAQTIILKQTPVVDFTGRDGQGHRLWAVTGESEIVLIQEVLKNKKIFIADGHHRYETALNYRTQRQSQENQGPGAPYEYVMMTLVNLYDPGLVIFPTHRLVKNVPQLDMEGFIKTLANMFTVEEYQLKPGADQFKLFLEALSHKGTRELPGGGHPHAYGLYTGSGRGYLLTLKESPDIKNLMPRDKSAAWIGLDVSVLHTLVMEKLLGIGGQQRASESNLTYSREEEGALQKVDSGEYQLAFFLNPTLVEEVTTVAANGEKMPQKSTFFYPKLPTGLIINQL